MKKKITIWLLTLCSFLSFAQDCEGLQTKYLNGEIYDFLLEDCTGRVFIQTYDHDTILHGITLVDAKASVNLRASGSNRISIKPEVKMYFIDYYIQ